MSAPYVAPGRGTTLETLTNQTLVRKTLRDAGLDPCRQWIAVTGEGSRMVDPDRSPRAFHIYDYTGGRYAG